MLARIRALIRERNAFSRTETTIGPGAVWRTKKMKRLALTAALAGSIALTGCATNPYGSGYGYGSPYYGNGYYNNGYGNNGQLGRAATGAAVGAAGGAVAGAVIPGLSTGEGAIAGAILGGVLGAVVNGKQYYRDTRGYCYYVDQYGQPHYNYNVRC
jgi:hypothetical protein